MTGIKAFDIGLNNYSTSFTGAVTTTSNTFSVISSQTITPPAGTYLTMWSGQVAITSGANGNGEVALFVAGTQQTVTTRTIAINIALLLGIIGTATTNPNGGNITTLLTVNGTQAIDVRFRSTSGNTIQAARGNLILLRVA